MVHVSSGVYHSFTLLTFPDYFIPPVALHRQKPLSNSARDTRCISMKRKYSDGDYYE